MTMEERLRAKLTAAFSPTALTITNESHMHAGHHGSPDTGESHFRVHIVAARFADTSRIERHRLVNEVLAAELKAGIHALTITAEPPRSA